MRVSKRNYVSFFKISTIHNMYKREFSNNDVSNRWETTEDMNTFERKQLSNIYE